MSQKFTLTTTEAIIEEIKVYYQAFGTCSLMDTYHCIDHHGLDITIHESTAIFSGQNAKQAYQLWLSREATEHQSLYFHTALGSDESGAGDYFGPLTIVSAYVPKESIAILEQLGIRKSSKLTDEKIMEIVPEFIKIKDQTNIIYSAIILNNEKYNELINKGLNLNQVKAILHNQALAKTIEKIGFKPEKIIVDKFVNEKNYFQYLKIQKNVVDHIIFSPAKSNFHISIALSSIIARYMFLKEMAKLNSLTGLDLSKGSNVQA
ncbi:MAG: ribonuclease HIII, partial [Culicoidibacterales bacterium]